MRMFVAIAITVVLGIGSRPGFALGASDKPPDPLLIAALEARLRQAAPRDQCYLYAELLQQLTELSLQRYAAGNVEEASALLQRVQQTAGNLHQALAQRGKRLKNTEILLRRAAFRLTEMLHSSSYEDRPLVEQTLSLVTRAQTATMMQVFRNN